MDPLAAHPGQVLFTRDDLEKIVKMNDKAMREFSYKCMKAVSSDCERHAALANSDKIDILAGYSQEVQAGFAMGCDYMAKYFESQWKEFKKNNSH